MGRVVKKIKRHSEIISLLKRSEEGLTTKELSEKLKVSQRCIQKDIKTLLELGFDIKKTGKRYRLSSSNKLYVDLLSETEIFYLLSLNKALQDIYPTESHSLYKLITTKILPAKKYEEVILFGMDYAMKTEEEDREKIKTLIDAIQTKQRVCFMFEYRRKEGGKLKSEKQKIKVEPYRIGYHRGFWYLIGSKVEGNTTKLRVFSLYKISDIKILNERFSEIPDYIRNIKVFRPYMPEAEDSQKVTAKIKVMSEALIYFEKKNFAEYQQKIETLEDGSAIFEIKAASLMEILQLIIIPWIPHVIVLEPPELAWEAWKRTTRWRQLQKEHLPTPKSSKAN